MHHGNFLINLAFGKYLGFFFLFFKIFFQVGDKMQIKTLNLKLFFFFFCLFRAAPEANGGSQDRG